MIISRSFLLTMRNMSDKCCRENQNTQFIFHNLFFNCAVYDIQWKNNAELDGSQITIWRMWTAYLILALQSLRICNIFAFTIQQWLPKCASTSRYTYIACLVIYVNISFIIYRVHLKTLKAKNNLRPI
jgi:uncharacterized membrane protein